MVTDGAPLYPTTAAALDTVGSFPVAAGETAQVKLRDELRATTAVLCSQHSYSEPRIPAAGRRRHPPRPGERRRVGPQTRPSSTTWSRLATAQVARGNDEPAAYGRDTSVVASLLERELHPDDAPSRALVGATQTIPPLVSIVDLDLTPAQPLRGYARLPRQNDRVRDWTEL
jgi:hypothetical protein